MEKEYGKLTADQFREFIGKLPELRQQRDEFGYSLVLYLDKLPTDCLQGKPKPQSKKPRAIN